MEILINVAPGGFSHSDNLVRRLAEEGFGPAEEALRRWAGGKPHRRIIQQRDRLLNAMHAAIGDMAAFRTAQQALNEWTNSPDAVALNYGRPSETFAWVLAERARAQGLPADLPQRILPEIVAAVKTMGLKAASGAHCEMAIAETPDGKGFSIVEEAGAEALVVGTLADTQDYESEVLVASAEGVARTLAHWSAEPGSPCPAP
jgi:hypothetical protein